MTYVVTSGRGNTLVGQSKGNKNLMGEGKRAFGSVRKIGKGERYQARYTGPDGIRYKGPRTYETKDDALGWLNGQRRKIELEVWVPPTRQEDSQGLTLREYGERRMRQRKLKARTRSLYEGLLRLHIYPAFGEVPLTKITADSVNDWYAELDTSKATRNAHAYSLLNSIFVDALADDLIDRNPCRIRGAMVSKSTREIEPLTADELAKVAAAMPDRLRMSVLIAGWCGLRWGEFTELRRKDVRDGGKALRIERGVTYRAGVFTVSTPKTRAGVRTVSVPPHIRSALKDHLAEHVGKGKDALLFPAPTGGHIGDYAYRKAFKKACEAIGRDDVRVHDLRHCGAVLAAQAGATTAELMLRIGHTTPAMAQRYQHVARGRDEAIARAMSGLAASEESS